MGLAEEPAPAELIGSRSVCVASLCRSAFWCLLVRRSRPGARGGLSRSQWSRRARPCRGLCRACDGPHVLAARGLPEPVLISPAASSAGLFTQKLTYENGVLKMNYTGGDTCHKVYQRSTTIFFYCDRSTQTVSVLRAGTLPWLCCLLLS